MACKSPDITCLNFNGEQEQHIKTSGWFNNRLHKQKFNEGDTRIVLSMCVLFTDLCHVSIVLFGRTC